MVTLQRLAGGLRPLTIHQYSVTFPFFVSIFIFLNYWLLKTRPVSHKRGKPVHETQRPLAVYVLFLYWVLHLKSLELFRACLHAYSSPSGGLQRRCSRPNVAGPSSAKCLAGRWCRLGVPASASSSSAVHTLYHWRRHSLRAECGCHWLRSFWRTCCGSARPSTRRTNQSSSSGTFLTLRKQRQSTI